MGTFVGPYRRILQFPEVPPAVVLAAEFISPKKFRLSVL